MQLNKLAFTLIELLVVIAIIGILSGLIVVSMSGVTAKANIAKAQVFSNSLRNSLMLNLVSEWKLDEASGTATNDSWSGGNNGVLYNFADTTAGYGDSHTSGWMSSSNCISGTCLKFDGTNDYVGVADKDNLDVSSITMSAWIKTGDTVPADWATVVAKGYQADNDHFWLHYRSSGVFKLECGNGSTRYSAVYYLVPSLNTWYHIAGTYTNGSGYLYINGVRGTQQTSLTGDMIANTYPLTIGRASYTTSYYWNNIIDDVRIFNSAATASEIREQYYVGLNKMLNSGNIDKEEYTSRINNLISKNELN